MKKAVFLDRDGVLNQTAIRGGKPRPPHSLGELQILSGVKEALQLFKKAGFFLIVVTNQPDVGRGHQKREIVEEINTYLRTTLALDDVYVCYDETTSSKYKPAPGMLFEAALQHNIDLSQSYMIGDRWRDISAGKNAGCTSVLIDYEYGEPFPDAPDINVASLLEAAQQILTLEHVETLQ